MTLRFNTSIGGRSCSYMEGQTIEVPTLTDEHRRWLAAGFVSVIKRDAPEAAVEAAAPEQAVVGRRGRRGTPPVDR